MQYPTLTNVRIRSTRDALQIFFAVSCNIIPLISRRLDAEERRAIAPGNVYVWEERCANSEATGLGMERWTDGMGWGPSRVRDDFLFYHQRESDTTDDPNNPSAKWASIMKRREPRAGGPSSFSRTEAERLIKQTYSVHVTLPADRITRKWHLTAYFSQTTLDSLQTLDRIPNVGNLVVPNGLFKSARAGKGRRGDISSADEGIPLPLESWAPHPHLQPHHVAPSPVANYGVSHFPVDHHQPHLPHHSSPDRPSWPQPAQDDGYYHPHYPAYPSEYHHSNGSRPHVPPTAPSSTSISTASSGTVTLPPYGNGRSSASPTSAASSSSSASSLSSSSYGGHRLPGLSDSGLEAYRDPSPFTHSSSSTSTASSSPRNNMLTPPPPPSSSSSSHHHHHHAGARDRSELVPLEFLENISPPARDPLDEEALRRISAMSTSGSSSRRY